MRRVSTKRSWPREAACRPPLGTVWQRKPLLALAGTKGPACDEDEGRAWLRQRRVQQARSTGKGV